MNTPTDIAITQEMEELARRPYAVLVTQDSEDGYIGHIPELPGLLAVGDTLDEMYVLVEDAKRPWIATAVALGRPVPPPRPVEETPTKSDKFVVRIAPPIHAALAQEAERHGISLNELASTVFSLVVANGFDGIIEAVTQCRDAVREVDHAGVQSSQRIER